MPRRGAGRYGAREGEVDALGLARGDGHVGRPGAEALVPGRHDVVAGWQLVELEGAVSGAHGSVRVIEHSHVRLHPGMDVTLELDGRVGLVDRDRP